MVLSSFHVHEYYGIVANVTTIIIDTQNSSIPIHLGYIPAQLQL